MNFDRFIQALLRFFLLVKPMCFGLFHQTQEPYLLPLYSYLYKHYQDIVLYGYWNYLAQKQKNYRR